MKIVIFGLSVTSAWGNGHATLWRGLIRALAARGHDVTFYERDTPYYAAHRDLTHVPWGRVVVYADWPSIAPTVRRALRDADAAIITSYAADGRAADEAVRDAARPLHVFYDLDTPVTLAALDAGDRPAYLPIGGLGHCDLVLSFVGGRAVGELRAKLGARRVVPIYGHVDPDAHRPTAPDSRFRAGLSYLGTFADDRQAGFERLFLEPARRREDEAFLLGGAQWPEDLSLPPNVRRAGHVSPGDLARFYCSARLNLNLTRATMAAFGYCPSGRLFEIAASGAPMISDVWEGVGDFFEPGEEILLANDAGEVEAALSLSDAELARIAAAARERVLAEHTSMARAITLEDAIEDAAAKPVSALRTDVSATSAGGV